MQAALELSNLPPTCTFEELRALCGARGAVFSLGAPGHRALVLFDSPDAAAAAREMLHGADWGTGVPLAAADVPQGPVGWLAAEVPGYLSPGAAAATSSRAGGSSASLASQQQQQQQQQPAAQQQQTPPAPAPLPVATPAAAAAEPPSWAEGVSEEWLPVWDEPYDAAAAAAAPAVAPSSSGVAADSGWQEARPSGGRPASAGRPRRAPAQQAAAGSSGGGAHDPDLSDVRIMIRNMHPDVTQRKVESVCAKFGKLLQAVKHPGKRFAHVQYARPEAAATALRALHEQLVPELNPDGAVYAEYSLPANDRVVRKREERVGGSSSGATRR